MSDKVNYNLLSSEMFQSFIYVSSCEGKESDN